MLSINRRLRLILIKINYKMKKPKNRVENKYKDFW